MIKAVVFDLGMVVFDWQIIYREFAKEIDVPFDELMRVFFSLTEKASTGKQSLEEFLQEFTKAVGHPDKWQDLRKKEVVGFVLIEPTIELLKELEGRFRLAALTNAEPGIIDEIEEKFKIKKYFELVVDSSVEGIMKPDKRIYEITAERLGVKPEECLFIDDLKENVEGARKVGFKAIQFGDPVEGVKEIKKALGLG